MSAISEDGLGGPSFGLGNCICLQCDDRGLAARVKLGDVAARRAGARKIRAGGTGSGRIFADSACVTGSTVTAKAAVPNTTGEMLMEGMTSMHGGFPTIISKRSGRDQAFLGGFTLDAGNRTVLGKLP